MGHCGPRQTWFPSVARSSSLRTLTGTNAFSSSYADVLAASHPVPGQRERDHGQHDIVKHRSGPTWPAL